MTALGLIAWTLGVLAGAAGIAAETPRMSERGQIVAGVATLALIVVGCTTGGTVFL